MTAYASKMMAAVLFLAPTPTLASLTVTPGLTVHNKCRYDVSVAVRYKDRGTWTTSPFTAIRAGQREERVVSSNNSVFYYYAEGGRVRWSGDHSVNVGSKIYPMKETRLTFDRQRNRYYLGLTCNS
jgi:hypothetical protein